MGQVRYLINYPTGFEAFTEVCLRIWADSAPGKREIVFCVLGNPKTLYRIWKEWSASVPYSFVGEVTDDGTHEVYEKKVTNPHAGTLVDLQGEENIPENMLIVLAGCPGEKVHAHILHSFEWLPS